MLLHLEIMGYQIIYSNFIQREKSRTTFKAPELKKFITSCKSMYLWIQGLVVHSLKYRQELGLYTYTEFCID